MTHHEWLKSRDTNSLPARPKYILWAEGIYEKKDVVEHFKKYGTFTNLTGIGAALNQQILLWLYRNSSEYLV